MEILVDDETSFYDHNTTIIPYGSKNVKNSWNTAFNFFTLTTHDTKKSIITIFYGNKKKSQLSILHFNTIYGNMTKTPSEPISKSLFS